jgi:hypothetical protein
VILFEERDDLNLAFRVASDFMRADINYVLIHIESEHKYMPQHTFEDAKKLVVPELPPGYYRLMIFMQNVEVARNTIFQPIVFQFSFKVFSFNGHDNTFVHLMGVEDDELQIK